MSSKRFSYGGQAVIEGVMMRGRRTMAIAVRNNNRDIVLNEETLQPLADKYPFLGWPIIRGAVSLVETLVISIKALNYSASVIAEDEGEELGTKELVLTMAMALLLTVGIFIVLPAFLLRFVQSHITSNVLLNVVEGLIKITLFVSYIALISQMADIRRVFQYHGAEHKTINCYEQGEELTLNNVRKHSPIHARCGTNFILIVFFTSIFIFSFFGRPPFLIRVLTHLAILPLVAGLSYEVIKLAGKKNANPLVRAVAKPGLLLQKLTTREPDDDQIMVAIRSLEAVLNQEERKNQNA
ncbi:MAG TPA: DUF1385 domain-containing protein [Firmicutes bacterium]|nr:DUF1385 domain-containing protein [Bacillota bacterium]